MWSCLSLPCQLQGGFAAWKHLSIKNGVESTKSSELIILCTKCHALHLQTGAGLGVLNWNSQAGGCHPLRADGWLPPGLPMVWSEGKDLGGSPSLPAASYLLCPDVVLGTTSCRGRAAGLTPALVVWESEAQGTCPSRGSQTVWAGSSPTVWASGPGVPGARPVSADPPFLHSAVRSPQHTGPVGSEGAGAKHPHRHLHAGKCSARPSFWADGLPGGLRGFPVLTAGSRYCC